MVPPPPTSTLFPYTTLFRSIGDLEGAGFADPEPRAVAGEEEGAVFRGGDRAEHLPDLRSEEHTSELQSRFELVCRLLLEKKNQTARRRCQSPKSGPARPWRG